MTNEEKIKEILSKHKPLILEDDNDCYCHGSYVSVPIVEIMLKSMGKWKDEQFLKEKEGIFEKAWEWFRKYAVYVNPNKDTLQCILTRDQFRQVLGYETKDIRVDKLGDFIYEVIQHFKGIEGSLNDDGTLRSDYQLAQDIAITCETKINSELFKED